MLKVFEKKDFINAKWFVAEKVVQLVVAILIIPKIFNELGTVDIGKLELSKALVAMLSPLLFLGFSAICIRELVFTPQKKHQILATAFYLRLITCVLILIGLSIYVYFTKDSEISIIMLLIGIGYLFRITDVLEYYIQAVKWSKLIFICKISTLFIIVSLQYYGLQQHFGVYYFAGIFSLDFLIQGSIYAVVLFGKKKLALKKWQYSSKMAIHLLKSSYPLIISNFVIVFYIGIDEVFIKYYLGDAANGVFATVQFLVIWLSWNIGAAFIYALYPAFAESYKTNQKLYAKRMGLAYKLVIAFGILIGVFYTFLGNIIIEIFYYETYSDAKVPLKIFSWAPLFVFIGVIYEKHLVNTDQLQKNIYRFVLGCFVNVILCYLLIPKYGVIGAAFAVLISHIITNLGYIMLDKKSRNYFIKAIKT